MQSLQNATYFEMISVWVVLGIAFVGLAHAMFFRRQVMRMDKVKPKCMRFGMQLELERMLI